MSSVWNFCRWVADFPPRETSPAAKSEEKRMFSQAMNMCLQWHTIPIPAIQYYNKKLNRGQLLWPAVCMLINKVSDDACQWNGHEVVISVGGIFLYKMLCMSHDTRRKVEHSVTLWQQFPLLCTRLLFVVNTLTMFLSFCYIECKLFAVFIKIFFDNWRRFCSLSVIYVPVKCPRGGGIWSPEWTLLWGIWTAFWPG